MTSNKFYSVLTSIRQLADFLSPSGWIGFQVAALLVVWVLFEPQWTDFFILYFASWGSVFLSLYFLNRYTRKAFPLSRFFLEPIHYAEIENLPVLEKKELLRSFSDFPSQRANLSFVALLIALIPLGLTILSWKSLLPMGQKIAEVLFVLLCFSGYFLVLVELTAHRFICNLVFELDHRFGWNYLLRVSECSFSLPFKTKTTNPIWFFGLLTFWGSFQGIFCTTHSFSGWFDLSLRVALLNFAGGFLFLNIVLSERRFFLERYELILARLDKGEKELASWVLDEAEKTRFRLIGELSALIVHDLSGPLNTIDFCSTALKSEQNGPKMNKYLDYLSANTARCLELIEAMRARLKNPSQVHREVEFMEAHAYVIKFLSMQFFDKGFEKIRFELDDEVKGLRFDVSRVDLIHILDNIYRNSIEDFIRSGNEAPVIKIKMSRKEKNYSQIVIGDNGSGLSVEMFEKLTQYGLVMNHTKENRSIGLRLTRRLVELTGGMLETQKSDDAGGTRLLLKLKTSEMERITSLGLHP